jgi:hypothetical protein
MGKDVSSCFTLQDYRIARTSCKQSDEEGQISAETDSAPLKLTAFCKENGQQREQGRKEQEESDSLL